MKVVEIFDSIEGEGKRTGQTATFIRLAGCNIRCSYCDTTYALFGESEECKYQELEISDIISRVNKNWRRVTITGGEPLIHKDVDKLIAELSKNDCQINIETNGTINTSEFTQYDNVFVSIDYKLPSSGVCDKMQWENFTKLKNTDVIKFIVGSEDDICMMKEIISRLRIHYTKDTLPIIYVGAVFENISPARIVEEIISDRELSDVIFQLQIHKFIWGPEKTGV